MPVITGIKTEAEKFAGAEKTYCIEAMMRDKKALQAGTSHDLGQNFAKAFDVKFQTKDNREELVWATSWGISTRLVGAIILTHGDDKGLRLPPKIAPIQVVVIPIFKSEEQQEIVKNYIQDVVAPLKKQNIRVYEDWTDNTPGFKFNKWEMKGVPLRLEVGLRDVEKNNIVIVRRDNGNKDQLIKKDVVKRIPNILNSIHKNLFSQANKFMIENTHNGSDFNAFKKIIKEGWFCQMWMGWRS